MEATTIAVIVLVTLFLGGMTALMIVINTSPKEKKEIREPTHSRNPWA